MSTHVFTEQAGLGGEKSALGLQLGRSSLNTYWPIALDEYVYGPVETVTDFAAGPALALDRPSTRELDTLGRPYGFTGVPFKGISGCRQIKSRAYKGHFLELPCADPGSDLDDSDDDGDGFFPPYARLSKKKPPPRHGWN